MELKIHERLKRCLNQLSQDEYDALEANIIEAGKVRDKIRYMEFEGENLIVDGFHRFDIAKKHGVPYEVEFLDEVTTLEEAEQWMRRNQLGRRNVDGLALTMLRASMAEQLEGNMESIATELDVSVRTLHLDKEVAGIVESMPEDIRKRIKDSNLIASSRDIRAFGKLSEEEKSEAYRMLRENEEFVLRDAMPKANKSELDAEGLSELNQMLSPQANTLIAMGTAKADGKSLNNLKALSEDEHQLVGAVLENGDAESLQEAINLVTEPKKKAKKSPDLDQERLLKTIDKTIKQIDDLAITLGKEGSPAHEEMVDGLETVKSLLEQW